MGLDRVFKESAHAQAVSKAHSVRFLQRGFATHPTMRRTMVVTVDVALGTLIANLYGQTKQAFGVTSEKEYDCPQKRLLCTTMFATAAQSIFLATTMVRRGDVESTVDFELILPACSDPIHDDGFTNRIHERVTFRGAYNPYPDYPAVVRCSNWMERGVAYLCARVRFVVQRGRSGTTLCFSVHLAVIPCSDELCTTQDELPLGVRSVRHCV